MADITIEKIKQDLETAAYVDSFCRLSALPNTGVVCRILFTRRKKLFLWTSVRLKSVQIRSRYLYGNR